MTSSAPPHSKKSIHVFASDFLPYPGFPRTAGGNRSLQVISALRNAGHRVTSSMPLTNYLAKRSRQVTSQFTKDELWASENFYEPSVVLNKLQPDISIFCNINMFRTVSRFPKEVVHIVDCYGPLQFESLLIDAADHEDAMQDGKLLEERCRILVERMRGIDYLVTVSERQKYFWSAYCSLAGFSFSDLNLLVCPAAFSVPEVSRNTSPDLTVVYSGGFYPWQNPDRFLLAAARLLDRIEGATFHIFGGPHAGLPNEVQVHKLLDDLQEYSCVKYHGYRPVEELTAMLSTAWCALELMERNIERELAVTGRTVEFLSAGTPVIYNDYSSLSKLIGQYNAGWTLNPDDAGAALEEVFGKLLAGGHSLVDKLSRNARRLAAEEFDAVSSMAPLVDLCGGNLRKREQSVLSRHRVSSLTKLPDINRVLAVSPDGDALRDLRITNPLRALQRGAHIGNYKVADLWFSSLKNDSSTYDCIIVQRAVAPFIYQIFRNLSLPFLLDVDDNLLARAAYRRHERVETEILVGLRYCTALTAPNPRLVGMLEKYSGVRLAEKVFITPNSLPFAREYPLRSATRPSRIVWIQSDIAALSSSKDAITSAVERFSVRHNLPVLLIGRRVVDEVTFTNGQALGEIDFNTNLQFLQFLPTSIGVAPLETVADDETLDFVSGKSDLKILLFSGYGHPGVYSAATPYTDSSLNQDLKLVNNTQADWLEALAFQLNQGWHSADAVAARIQSQRSTDKVAAESWLPALQSCILPKPVRGFDLYEAFRASSTMAGTPASKLSYLLANGDILDYCIRHEDYTSQMHYDSFGYSEDRRYLHSPQAHESLLQELDVQGERWLRHGREQIRDRQEEKTSQRLLDTPENEKDKTTKAERNGPDEVAETAVPAADHEEGTLKEHDPQILNSHSIRDSQANGAQAAGADQSAGQNERKSTNSSVENGRDPLAGVQESIIIAAQSSLDTQIGEVEHLQRTITDLRDELKKLEDLFSGILKSRSWRLTAPLREWAQQARKR